MPIKISDAKKLEHMTKPDIERFCGSYIPEPNSGCWVWSKHPKSFRAYPQFYLRGTGDRVLAHRAAWYIHRGAIPDGGILLHGCDNRHCVNPRHLTVGTPKKNWWDCIERGRHINKQPNWATSLSHDAIKHIRYSALKNTELAKKYGVTGSTVQRIKTGKTWNQKQRDRGVGVGYKRGRKPASVSEFLEKYAPVIEAVKSGMTYAEAAVHMKTAHKWPMSRQRVHQICKKAGIA